MGFQTTAASAACACRRAGSRRSDPRCGCRHGEAMLNEFMTAETSPSTSIEQTMVSGEPHELDLVRGANLVENVGQVPLDGVCANRKPLRDFLVRVAAEHRTDDIELAPGQ